jgi:hypothetical protein
MRSDPFDRDDRLVADDPGIVSRRDVEDIVRTHGHLAAVIEPCPH